MTSAEKTPLQSKKFIAFLVSTLTMKVLYVSTLAWAWNLDQLGMQPFLLLLTEVVVDGFITIGYILGQAGLDRYVRMAQIASHESNRGPVRDLASDVIEPKPVEE